MSISPTQTCAHCQVISARPDLRAHTNTLTLITFLARPHNSQHTDTALSTPTSLPAWLHRSQYTYLALSMVASLLACPKILSVPAATLAKIGMNTNPTWSDTLSSNLRRSGPRALNGLEVRKSLGVKVLGQERHR